MLLPPGRGRGSIGRLDRLLPDRPLARRPGRGAALARPLPQPRAGGGARHRPRLPARHPRAADPARCTTATAASAAALIARVRDLPRARRDPRARQGAGAAAAPTSTAWRAASDGWSAANVGEELRAARRACAERAGDRRFRALGALCRRDRRPAAPPLPAPGRHGRLRPARSAELVPLRARGDGGPPALPVGQGLLRRRGLPQDRPARPGHAVGGRGVRRVDRAQRAARRVDLSRIPLDDPERLRRDPGGGHRRRVPDRVARPDADAAADAAAEPRRPRRSRSRSCGRGRSRAAPCTPTCSGRRPSATTPGTRCPYDHPLLAEALAETLGVIVFQDQVLDVAQALAGFSPGRPRRCAER